MNAAFPEIQISDLCSFGVPKPLLWQNLRLQHINSDLSSEMSTKEIQIAKTMAAGGDTTIPEILRVLDPVEMRFGVFGQGSEPSVVHFELLNSGNKLPVVWSISSQDSAGVEMENWVEDAIPLSNEERHLQFIMEHRIFDYHPKSGVLDPGATCCLTVTYKHIAPGIHVLPVLLQVRPSSQCSLTSFSNYFP